MADDDRQGSKTRPASNPAMIESGAFESVVGMVKYSSR
jgi:hypothetical protein